jgi:hypothetical protein
MSDIPHERAKPGSLESKVAHVVAFGVKAGIAPLLARLDALEAKPTVEYGGTYADGKHYCEGQLITRSGALWLCLRSTCDVVPGSDPAFFKLVCKSGDAR